MLLFALARLQSLLVFLSGSQYLVETLWCSPEEFSWQIHWFFSEGRPSSPLTSKTRPKRHTWAWKPKNRDRKGADLEMDTTNIMCLCQRCPYTHTHTHTHTHTASEVYLEQVKLMPLPSCVNASLHYGNNFVIASCYSTTQGQHPNTHSHTTLAMVMKTVRVCVIQIQIVCPLPSQAQSLHVCCTANFKWLFPLSLCLSLVCSHSLSPSTLHSRWDLFIGPVNQKWAGSMHEWTSALLPEAKKLFPYKWVLVSILS